MKKIVSILTDKRFLMVLIFAVVFSSAVFGQSTYKSFSAAAQTATNSLKENVKAVLVIIQIICAAVSIFSLGWALWRRNKGEGQSNDAIMTVFISLIVVMIILEVVNQVWLV